MARRSETCVGRLRTLAIGLAVLVAGVAWAAQSERPVGAAGVDWNKLLRALQSSSRQVGIQVLSLTDRRVIFEHESRQRLIPASVLKLLTGYAALKRLGPYYQFNTEVWSRHAVRDGVLPGDVWIKGTGDPYLVPERLYLLAQKLREQGIRRIDGNIHIDNGYFLPQVERLCLDGQCDRAYNPVLAATSFSFNTLTLHFLPSGTGGGVVLADVFPHGDYALIDHRSGAAGGKSDAQGLTVHSTGVARDGREGYTVTGRLAASSGEDLEIRVNANDPVGFFGRSFRALLSEVGIEVRGHGIDAAIVPSDARKIAEYVSPPLKDLLHGLNRYSNNFMAEMLLRVLGADVKGPPGNAEKGMTVLGETLASIGIPAAELELDGGSGLSRRCRISAHALGAVLVAAFHDPAIAPEFLASLASGGEEGTLRRRGERLASPSLIRGKTGSLSDVVAFAGYVTNPAPGPYAVVILLNEVQRPAEAKAAIDRFLSDLAENSDPTRAKTPRR